MNGPQVDFRLVEKVWNEIDNSDNALFQEKASAIRRKYSAIKAKLVGGASTLDADKRPAPSVASPREPAAAPEEIAISVLAFVARAGDYYNAVRAHRELTEQEKLIGRDLLSLLEQAERILPTG